MRLPVLKELGGVWLPDLLKASHHSSLLGLFSLGFVECVDGFWFLDEPLFEFWLNLKKK